MQEGLNKKSLFRTFVVPPSPVRPQSAIDFERKQHKQKASGQALNYDSQLFQRNRDKWAPRSSLSDLSNLEVVPLPGEQDPAS